VVAEYIAIPLGSSYAKEKLDKINYFLFYGPMGSGKTLCVRALATECNAMVIDISPSTIESKATDKNSIAKIFYMAFTIA
jgi:SpoVK/Ycf46/Vps4 family AAA+-type ATPase